MGLKLQRPAFSLAGFEFNDYFTAFVTFNFLSTQVLSLTLIGSAYIQYLFNLEHSLGFVFSLIVFNFFL